MNKKFYVYIHTKPNGEVFYVGKGTAKRAWKKNHRNRLWHYTAKDGYEVIIKDYYDTDEEAQTAEIKLVAEYRSLGYNLVNQTDGGDGGSTGRVWSEKTRKKLSKASAGENNGMFGKTHTDDVKKLISENNKGSRNGMFGQHHSEETKKKLRAAWKRRRLTGTSEETRALLSKIRTGTGNGMYGRTHSAETKLKMSEIAKKRKHSKESKKKISNSLKQRHK